MFPRISPASPAHPRSPRPSSARSRSSKTKRVLALIPLLGLGCASLQELFGWGEADRPLVEPAERPNRIALLEASIEQDHDTLKALVSGQRDDSDDPLHENPELRAIAERLSQNEEELEALRRAENPLR